MSDATTSLLSSLADIDSITRFKGWVRSELRYFVPHATFLGTLGRLYGLGSVATHRVDVDFSLGIIEELKNSAGALEDPLLFGWLRSERIRYVELAENGPVSRWRDIVRIYGIHCMVISGVLDHESRRFFALQLGNPFAGGSADTHRMLRLITPAIAERLWAIMDSRDVDVRQLVGHPTLSLSKAELQIVQLIAQGLSNKQIARIRRVSDSTIKTQVQRTGAKLGATRRAEIVAIAMPMLSPLPPQTLIDYDDEIV